MELLKSYLHSVRLYLPKGQKGDIIRELSDNLQSQMEAKARELGRPLTEAEQADVLQQHGDPLIVASRYRVDHPTVAFGKVLISAEMFPVYLILLSINLAITALIVGLSLADGRPLDIQMLFVSLGIQFVVVTAVAATLDVLRRKFPQTWLNPPLALALIAPIPRWQSLSGLIVWSVVALWWSMLPHAPTLIFGTASDHLVLTPAWRTYYVPILALLLAGIGQRSINLMRPHWTWVHSFTRMATNVVGLFLQYSIIAASPYVLPADAVKGLPQYDHLAGIYNAVILWGVLCWLWVFLLINALVHTWQCVLHIRRWIRLHHDSSTAHLLKTDLQE